MSIHLGIFCCVEMLWPNTDLKVHPESNTLPTWPTACWNILVSSIGHLSMLRIPASPQTSSWLHEIWANKMRLLLKSRKRTETCGSNVSLQLEYSGSANLRLFNYVCSPDCLNPPPRHDHLPESRIYYWTQLFSECAPGRIQPLVAYQSMCEINKSSLCCEFINCLIC